MIKRYIKPGSKILECGSGPANKTSAFLATLGQVTGLDISSEVSKNQYCHNTIVYDGVHIPCPADHFDAVVSNYVCEHIEAPLEVCRELWRVLQSGGVYVFRTPNLWHYSAIGKMLIPHRFHRFLCNWLSKFPPDSYEPYPTFYRMNTRRTICRTLRNAGFRVVLINCIEKEPGFGLASRFLFYPMVAWERILNSTRLLDGFRGNILCVAIAKK